MNIVKFFEFDQVQIRTVTIGFDLWFVAQDICRILTIVNIGQALSRLDDDEKSYLEGDTLICLTDDPDVTRLSAVNESGLYSLILSSRKKVAKPFKRWVTHDVLPSIRKTGSYHLDKERAEIKQLTATLEEEKKELRFMSASLSRQQSELDDRSEFLLLAQKRYMENPDRIRKVADSPLTLEEKKREIELRKQFPDELLLWETETKIKIMVLANKFGKISISQLMEYDLGLSPEQYPPLLIELAEDHGAKVEGEGLNMVYTSQRVLMEAIDLAMKAYR
jgi:prophage antirepressor-like protein